MINMHSCVFCDSESANPEINQVDYIGEGLEILGVAILIFWVKFKDIKKK